MVSNRRQFLLHCGARFTIFLLLALFHSCDGFVPNALTVQRSTSSSSVVVRHMAGGTDDNKFGFGQRIESVKAFAVGAIVGSVGMTPVGAIHDLVLASVLAPWAQTNGLAQWEFDTDMASFEAGLFAIVYRYCVRQDINPQLGEGVVGAFALTRALSRVAVPPYCSAVVLDCGPPFGYLDWLMIGQILINGIESLAIFGTTAAAMEYCAKQGYISKFPG